MTTKRKPFRCELFTSTELDTDPQSSTFNEVRDRHHWRLRARNGVIVAGSVQGAGYRDRRSATEMFDKIVAMGPDDVKIVDVDE
jgi:uncharacterized protein YegP (UPF0339 family)